MNNWAKEFDKWIGKASQPKRVVIRKGMLLYAYNHSHDEAFDDMTIYNDF